MIYTFQDEDTGEEVDLVMGHEHAPSIGSVTTYEGRRLRRLPSSGVESCVKKSVGHVSRSLPPWTPGADSYTKEGFPVIEGQGTIDKIKKLNTAFNYGDDAIQR